MTQACRRHYKGLTLATLTIVALIAPLVMRSPSAIDGPLLDILVGLRGAVFPSSPNRNTMTVVVAIDERSLREPELASYPRTLLAPMWAELLTTVMEAGAKTVGVDFVWAYTANNFLPNYDRPLLAALNRYRDHIVLAHSKHQYPATPFLAATRFDPEAVGLADLPVDSDGVSRRVPLIDPPDGEPSSPTFAAAILHRAGVKQLPREILLAPHAHAEQLPVYSVIDVLRCAKVAPSVLDNVFQGKIVLVGSTLAEEDRKVTTGRYLPMPHAHDVPVHSCGLRQLGPSTPGSPTVPGVFVHATAIETVLSGQMTRVVEPIYVGALVSLSALIGTAAGLFWPPLIAVITVAIGWVLLVGGAVGFLVNDWWIPIAMPLIGIAVPPLLAAMVRSSIEGSARRRLQQEMYFLTGLSSTMLERLAAGETVLRVDGETAEITVMFADLSGFTKLSTEASSEVFIEQSRRTLAYIVQEIEAKGGWVNQFLGDCVMAIWGAPLGDSLHATHAVQAALASTRRIAEARTAFSTDDARALDIKIGVNSGLASIGKFGTGERGAYTAAGDSVNVAARFAQIPARYGCRIIVGEETARRVHHCFLLRELDRVRVKGVSAALAIFEPIGELGESSGQQTYVDQYAEALGLYRQRRFSEAAQIWEVLGELESEQGSNPSRIMGERARRLAQRSFANEWDTVWDLSGSKEG